MKPFYGKPIKIPPKPHLVNIDVEVLAQVFKNLSEKLEILLVVDPDLCSDMGQHHRDLPSDVGDSIIG